MQWTVGCRDVGRAPPSHGSPSPSDLRGGLPPDWQNIMGQPHWRDARRRRHDALNGSSDHTSRRRIGQRVLEATRAREGWCLMVSTPPA